MEDEKRKKLFEEMKDMKERLWQIQKEFIESEDSHIRNETREAHNHLMNIVRISEK